MNSESNHNLPSVPRLMALPVPVSRVPIVIRQATKADIPFMDSLQKKHSKQLAYFPTKQFEGYIEQQTILIAEEGARCGRRSYLDFPTFSGRSDEVVSGEGEAPGGVRGLGGGERVD